MVDAGESPLPDEREIGKTHVSEHESHRHERIHRPIDEDEGDAHALAKHRDELREKGNLEDAEITQIKEAVLANIVSLFPPDLINRLKTDPRDDADIFGVASGDAQDSSTLTLRNLQELYKVGSDTALENGIRRFAPVAAYYVVKYGSMKRNSSGNGNLFTWEPHDLPETRLASKRSLSARFDTEAQALSIDALRTRDQQKLYSISLPTAIEQVNDDTRTQYGSTEYGRPDTVSKPFDNHLSSIDRLRQTQGFLECMSRATHDIALAATNTKGPSAQKAIVLPNS